jgi:energy-coupling factor transporter ATP-binding protein EcfA2
MTTGYVPKVWRDPVTPSLQRAQHIVAKIHGYGSWNDLLEAVPDRDRLWKRYTLYRHGWNHAELGHRIAIPCGSLRRPGHPSVIEVMGISPSVVMADAIAGLPMTLPETWPGYDAPPPRFHAPTNALRSHILALTGKSDTRIAAALVDPRLVVITGATASGKSTLLLYMLHAMSMEMPIRFWQQHGCHDGITGHACVSEHEHHLWRGDADPVAMVRRMLDTTTQGSLIAIDGFHDTATITAIHDLVRQHAHGDRHVLILCGQMLLREVWSQDPPPAWHAHLTQAVILRNPWIHQAPCMRLARGEAVIAHAWDDLVSLAASRMTHVENTLGYIHARSMAS